MVRKCSILSDTTRYNNPDRLSIQSSTISRVISIERQRLLGVVLEGVLVELESLEGSNDCKKELKNSEEKEYSLFVLNISYKDPNRRVCLLEH